MLGYEVKGKENIFIALDEFFNSIQGLTHELADSWEIALASHVDDAGVNFTITSAGQVQYSSTNMSGASYAGTLRLKNITKIAQ